MGGIAGLGVGSRGALCVAMAAGPHLPPSRAAVGRNATGMQRSRAAASIFGATLPAPPGSRQQAATRHCPRPASLPRPPFLAHCRSRSQRRQQTPHTAVHTEAPPHRFARQRPPARALTPLTITQSQRPAADQLLDPPPSTATTFHFHKLKNLTKFCHTFERFSQLTHFSYNPLSSPRTHPPPTPHYKFHTKHPHTTYNRSPIQNQCQYRSATRSARSLASRCSHLRPRSC